MQRLLLVVCCLIFVLGCSKNDTNIQTVRFWHFWSEPAQRAALESIVRDFEKLHPGVQVEMTALQWSDGKSKLHLAFNAGTQPDVLHLGLDWLAEFAEAGVLAPIPDSLRGNVDNMYAAPWTVNARALVRWNGAQPQYSWGLCATDAHNVIKRTLPMLWSFGASNFYTRMPLQQDMNESLVNALDSLRVRAHQHALIERSRDLDERFLRGEVEYLYTGAWIIDMAHQRNITSFEVLPTPSILNGDVLCVSKNTRQRILAEQFIAYLRSPIQATQFCAAVSDAGFPSTVSTLGNVGSTDAWRQGFLTTLAMSAPVASSASLLDAEPVIEDMIVQCYDARSLADVRRIVNDARSRLK